MRSFIIVFSFLVLSNYTFGQSINLERGLIAYYSFNENANDHTKFENHGTVYGAELRGDVRCGDGAYFFDGKMNYIDFGSSDLFNNQFRGLTISLMFQYINQNIEDFMTIFGKWAFDSKRDQFAIFLSVQKKLSFAIADGEDFGYGVYSNTNFEPYEWYHVIMVWNRSRKVGIFVNGKLDKMGKQHGNGFNTNSDISLKAGRQIVGENRPFTGLIDEIRIYNRSLSIPEMKTLYRIDNMVCNQFTLKGHVYNKATNEPVEGQIIFEELDTGEEFINVKSEEETGYFEIKLPIGYK